MDIRYTRNQGGLKEIVQHLTQCDNNFVPALSSTVNIQGYAQKLLTNAERLEAWEQNQLIGLVAAYMNDLGKETAFITNVSVLPEYSSKGIATRLLNQSINQAKEKGFKKVALEVSAGNPVALALYRKMDFTTEEMEKSNMLTMLKYL